MSSWQEVHTPLLQRSPAGQSAETQQLPCSHSPLQHTLPQPHCATFTHGWQVDMKHTRGVHSLSLQQSPGMHPPPQQRSPGLQSPSPWQIRQLWLAHFPPVVAAQSASLQQ